MILNVNQNKDILTIKYDLYEEVSLKCKISNDYDNFDRMLKSRRSYGPDILKQILNELKVLSDKYNNFRLVKYNIRCSIWDNDDETEICEFYLFGLRNDILINKTLSDLLNLINISTPSKIEGYAGYSDIGIELELLNMKSNNRKRQRTNIPQGLRKEVFMRDNYTCKECGAKKSEGATLHIDHIIPVSKGGTDTLDNLQTLCSHCNLNKSNIIQ